MIVPQLKGGLGNQMFTIAAAAAAARRNNTDFAINYNIQHHGQQGKPHTHYKDTFYKKIAITDLTPEYIYTEPTYSFTQIPNKKDMLLNGYFQTEKYFNEYKSETENLFFFSEEIKNKIDSKLLSLNKKILGVHIRIGDYLSPINYNSHFVCTPTYYINALNAIPNIDDYIIIICTDDPENVFKVFPKQDTIISNCKSELEDLYLLSQCNAHILTNSSFSWWGNYLGKDKEITIVPNIWFGPHGPKDYFDVYRSNWIKVNV